MAIAARISKVLAAVVAAVAFVGCSSNEATYRPAPTTTRAPATAPTYTAPTYTAPTYTAPAQPAPRPAAPPQAACGKGKCG